MSDLELLQRAAKAAGIELDPIGTVEANGKFAMLPDGRLWDPIRNDGDALRLAVKLQLTVCNEHLSAGCAYCTDLMDTSYPDVRSGQTDDHEVIPDDYVATRRAIVLAAAAIGAPILRQSRPSGA